jgi:DNA-binding GntR family transcriptional regulator
LKKSILKSSLTGKKEDMDTKVNNGCTEFIRRYWSANEKMAKHENLRQAITTSIIEGYWPPGARLPTESELVLASPCSLGTVQRALRALVDNGLIQRRRGSGTVVTYTRQSGKPFGEKPWHMRFFSNEPDKSEYLPLSTILVDRKIIKNTGPWSEPLKQGGHPVVRIDRIMQIADEFGVYSVFYALADRFPELTDRPMSELDGTNLKTFIASNNKMLIHKVKQQLRFELAPDFITTNSHWPYEGLTAVLNVVVYSIDGEVMYYQDFYIPPTNRILDLGTPTQIY